MRRCLIKKYTRGFISLCSAPSPRGDSSVGGDVAKATEVVPSPAEEKAYQHRSYHLPLTTSRCPLSTVNCSQPLILINTVGKPLLFSSPLCLHVIHSQFSILNSQFFNSINILFIYQFGRAAEVIIYNYSVCSTFTFRCPLSTVNCSQPLPLYNS